MTDQTLRQAIYGARARARFQADARGHRLAQFVNAPFVPVASPGGAVRSGTGCERCPARVAIAAYAVGSNFRAWRAELHGDAVSEHCTGVTRFVVDTGDGPTVAAWTASSSQRHITLLAGQWAANYPGRDVSVSYPTTGPNAGGPADGDVLTVGRHRGAVRPVGGRS